MGDILHQFHVNATTKQVFDAFTLPGGLNQWWPMESDGKPVLNEEYRFFFGPEYDWRAKVINVVDQSELTWQVTLAMPDWMPTQFGFRLTREKDGCKVFFFHRNWESASEHFASTNFCWGRLLNCLKDYVENGTVVPFEQRR